MKRRAKHLRAIACVTVIGLFLMACGGCGSSGSITPSSTNGQPALEITAGSTGGENYTQNSYLQGFGFTANSAITITQLGAYDSNYNVINGVGKQTFASTLVGVYDISTNTLLGQATVTASDPVTGVFHYHSLGSNTITLNTKDTYAVVWVSGPNYYTAAPPYTFTVNSAITYQGYAGVGAGNITTETTLVEPTVTNEIIQNLGPNFMFVTSR